MDLVWCWSAVVQVCVTRACQDGLGLVLVSCSTGVCNQSVSGLDLVLVSCSTGVCNQSVSGLDLVWCWSAVVQMCVTRVCQDWTWSGVGQL